MKRPLLSANLLALCFVFLTAESQALTLGRLRVLSPLGQPLNAEIDIADISPEEANSLRIAIATPEAFKTAGLEYNPSIANLTISGKRRPDGRAYLELRNSNAVNDPFLDLVLDISWATGRMVRDYTLLFDPPIGNFTAVTAAPNPTLPLVNTTPAPTQATPTTSTSASSAVMSLPSISATANRVTTTPMTSSGASGSSSSFSLGAITARTGSSVQASASTKPAPVSASRSTRKSVTKAESSNNKIAVKKGDTATSIALAEKPEGVSLDQMLVAMLKANPDAFINGNVNRLKSGVLLDVPTADDIADVRAQDAKSNLQVQSRDFNEYRRNLAGNVATTAQESSRRDATGKVTAKVEDQKTNAAPPDRLTLAKPEAMQKPGLEDKIATDRSSAQTAGRKAELEKNIADLSKVGAPTVPVLPPPPPPSPATPDPLPTGSPVVPAKPAPATAAPNNNTKSTGSWIDRWILNPLTLWIGGGVALLLLLAAWFRTRQRQRASDTLSGDSTKGFAQSQQATQTVFGNLGANQINTQESQNSTMVYSPSQFDSGTGDVDPIAEADVYLAYNRDVQAEEILKEAKRTTPKRTDVYVKLLEVYLKRHDVESFDATAQELHLICDGEGAHWARARDLAREIRSSSALFAVSGASFAASTEVPSIQSAYANNSLSFTPNVQIQTQNLMATAPVAAAPTPAPSSHLIDFDLSALTLDLQPPPANSPAATNALMQSVPENAKLALAEEYLLIGDKAGARGLIQEVIGGESDPVIVGLAQQMLGRIG